MMTSDEISTIHLSAGSSKASHLADFRQRLGALKASRRAATWLSR